MNAESKSIERREATLRDGQPPSGGTAEVWIDLIDGPVTVSEAEAFVRDDASGAVCVFVGTTRRFTDGRETVSLEYECYRGMALAVFEDVVAEARARWPILRACVLHAVGTVQLREASVCVAVATPHRTDAFDATRYIIDRIKLDAPIWKKEHAPDGRVKWLANNDS